MLHILLCTQHISEKGIVTLFSSETGDWSKQEKSRSLSLSVMVSSQLGGNGFLRTIDKSLPEKLSSCLSSKPFHVLLPWPNRVHAELAKISPSMEFYHTAICWPKKQV